MREVRDVGEPVNEQGSTARPSDDELALSRAANEYALRGWTFTDPVDDVRMAFKSGAAFNEAAIKAESEQQMEQWRKELRDMSTIATKAIAQVRSLREALRELLTALGEKDAIRHDDRLDGFVIPSGPDKGTVISGITFSDRFTVAIERLVKVVDESPHEEAQT